MSAAATSAAETQGDTMNNDWLGLSNAGVFIAGAGGIGRRLASAFAEAGARVVVADANSDSLAALSGVTTVQGDLTDSAACDSVVEQAHAQLGAIDVFVHAIGINRRVPILKTDDSTFDDIIRVNLASAFRLARRIGGDMCDRGYGRMVFISSVSGRMAHADHGPYAASKAGLDQLAKVMAREWAPSGVTVNTIAPGYLETDLTRTYLQKPGMLESMVELVPAGRLGNVDDLTGPALFLASRQSGFVTGQVLYVDGGRILV